MVIYVYLKIYFFIFDMYMVIDCFLYKFVKYGVVCEYLFIWRIVYKIYFL